MPNRSKLTLLLVIKTLYFEMFCMQNHSYFCGKNMRIFCIAKAPNISSAKILANLTLYVLEGLTNTQHSVITY